uniref:NRF domain-containing protein n=1 Tax=Steinernema glaseri TaxID=37863 RepID=A0A1I8AIY3_9BILA
MLTPKVLLLVLLSLTPLASAVEPQSHADDVLYDDEEASILSSMISEFMHDSEMQLILDLDIFRHFFSSSERKVVDAVQTGDVDYLNHILGFLEPLSHYDVSAPCLADLSHFVWTAIKYAKTVERRDKCANCSCTTNYKNEFSQNQWIFNVIDAMGKVPAAVTGGNNLWIGSWHTCRKISIQKNRQGQKWNGQYCMAHFQPYNRNNPIKAFASSQSAAKPNVTAHCSGTAQTASSEWSEDDYKCFDMFPLLNYGLCTPDTCTEYDVKKIMQFLYQSIESAVGQKLVCNVNVVCRNDRPESSMANDSKSMAMLFFVGFIAILMIFASLYDYIVYQKEIKPLSGDRTALKAFQEGQTWFIRCLLAFSMYTNGKSILKTAKGQDQIHCVAEDDPSHAEDTNAMETVDLVLALGGLQNTLSVGVHREGEETSDEPSCKDTVELQKSVH